MDEGTWKIMMKFFTQNQLVPVYRQKGGKQNRRFYQTVGKLGKIHHLKMKHNLCEHLFGRIDFSRNNFWLNQKGVQI